jgi:topoisomerase IA-like protein
MAPESVTFEQAIELLEARRNAAPSPRRAAGGRRRATAPRAAGPRVARRKAAGA